MAARVGVAAGVMAVAATVAASAAACGGATDHRVARRSPTSTTASTPSSPHTVPQGDRPFAVGVAHTTFVDPRRATSARGPTPAAPTRSLRLTVRYPAAGPAGPDESTDAPAAGGPFPLVVFAHGFDLSDATYPRFLHALAASGFVVADPEFPLSSAALPGPAVQGDEVEQARDLAFVIDRMLDPTTRPAALRSLRLDAPVAVAGHSDGGVTAVGLAGNGCCADARIGAAVILSGALGHFPGPWFTTQSPPLLAVYGDADEVNPSESSRRVYEAARAPKMLVVVHGGTHIGAFEGDASRSYVARLVGDFLRAYVLDDRKAAARLRSDASVAGVLELAAGEGIE